jgi:hypothetical protein
MSFIARVLSVEECERKWNPETQAHDGHRQWRLTFSPHADGRMLTVRTGREDFADRARANVGKLVYVARGGKEGIVGSVRVPIDEDFDALLHYAQRVSEERDAFMQAQPAPPPPKEQ